MESGNFFILFFEDSQSKLFPPPALNKKKAIFSQLNWVAKIGRGKTYKETMLS